MAIEDVTLTCVVPTLGRSTLPRTLLSIAEQMREGDEILVVPAREGSHHGDVERNYAIPHAKGSHLCFLDDDDIYLPDALDAMRDRATAVPTIFRMKHWAFDTIWNNPELRFGNVSTQMICVPNIVGKLGTWAPHIDGVGTDYTFIRGTCDLQGPPEWDERTISHARPK